MPRIRCVGENPIQLLFKVGFFKDHNIYRRLLLSVEVKLTPIYTMLG